MAQNAGEIYVQISAIADNLIKGVNKAASSFEAGMRRITSAAREAESAGQDLSLAVTAPLALAGGAALKTAASFEKTEIAIRRLSKSTEEANGLLDDLRKLGLNTPYSFRGLSESAKLMKGFGFETQQIIPTLSVLSDALSTFDDSDEALNRVLRQLGQIQTKGRVLGEELSVIAESGLPVYKIIQEQLKLTNDEMAKLGELGIPAAKAIPALLTGLSEEFAGMAAKQSRTLSGLFNKTKDELEVALSEIGEEIRAAFNIDEVLVGVSNGIKNLVAAFKSLNPEVKQFILVSTGIAAALGPIATIIGVIVGRVLPAFITGLRALSLVASPLALKIAAIAAVIGGVALVLKTAYDAFEGFRNGVIYVFNDVVYAARKWAAALQSIFAPVGRAIESLLGPALENAKQSFDELAKSSFGTKFADSFKSNIDSIKSFFSGFTDFFKAGGDDITNALTTNADDIRKAFEGALSGLSGDTLKSQKGLINQLNKEIEKYGELAAQSFDEQRIADYNDMIKSLQKEVERLNNLSNFKSPIDDSAVQKMKDFYNEVAFLDDAILEEMNFAQAINEEISKAVDENLVRKFGERTDQMVEQAEMLSNTLKRIVAEVAVTIGEVLGDALSGKDVDIGQTLFKLLASITRQLGETAISIGVAIAGINAAITSLNAYAAIAAGIALVALSQALKNGLVKNSVGLADGGIIPGGYPNDTFFARLSSGEAVVDINKLYDSIEKGGGGSGAIVGRISGDQLLLIQERANMKRRKLR